MTGGGVNQAAVGQEQKNQQQGQQYAQQQQAAALAGLQKWLSANPAPTSTTGAIAPPMPFSTPAAGASGPPAAPQAQPPPQAQPSPQAPPQAQPQPRAATPPTTGIYASMTPQQRAAVASMLGGQRMAQ